MEVRSAWYDYFFERRLQMAAEIRPKEGLVSLKDEVEPPGHPSGFKSMHSAPNIPSNLRTPRCYLPRDAARVRSTSQGRGDIRGISPKRVSHGSEVSHAYPYSIQGLYRYSSFDDYHLNVFTFGWLLRPRTAWLPAASRVRGRSETRRLLRRSPLHGLAGTLYPFTLFFSLWPPLATPQSPAPVSFSFGRHRYADL